MAFIPLRNIGAGGIVTDQDPYDLELTQFPVGNNVSFHQGRIGKSFGHSLKFSTTYAPTHIEGWMAQDSNTLIVGSLNKIFRYDGANETNVSKTSDAFDYTNSPRWQSAQLGTAMMMNNGSDVPQFMQPDQSRFQDLTAWPTGVFTKCLKPYKSFLIMAGYEGASTKHPFTVRWSDEYEPTGVPLDYSITSTTNLAGENTLGGNNGDLIDQLTLNNSQIIYAERGVFAMDFIGAPFVFSFREVFSDDGIINRGACSSFMGKHLVVGHNDIYIHDGNQKQSVAEKRVRQTFFNALVDTRSVYCQTINDKSEIWICYSDVNALNSQTANRALVYNWAQDAFTFVDLPDVRALAISDKVGVTLGEWDTVIGTWDNTTSYWSNVSQSSEANASKLYGAGYSALKVYTMNDTHAAAGEPILANLEATKIDLDQVLGRATNTIKQINGILPQIDGQGTVQISVGSSMSPQGGVTWGEPQTYEIESSYKIDVRSSGRYLALKVQSNSASDYWRLTGLDIDISEVAAR